MHSCPYFAFFFGQAGIAFGSVVVYAVFLVNHPWWTISITVAAIPTFVVIGYIQDVGYRNLPEIIAKRLASSLRHPDIPLIFGFKFGMTKEEVCQRISELVTAGVLKEERGKYYYTVSGNRGNLGFVYGNDGMCEIRMVFMRYMRPACKAIGEKLRKNGYAWVPSFSRQSRFRINKNVFVHLKSSNFNIGLKEIVFIDVSEVKKKRRIERGNHATDKERKLAAKETKLKRDKLRKEKERLEKERMLGDL